MGTEEWSRASCSAVTLPSKLRVFYVTDKPGRAFLKLSVVKPGLESAPPPQLGFCTPMVVPWGKAGGWGRHSHQARMAAGAGGSLPRHRVVLGRHPAPGWGVARLQGPDDHALRAGVGEELLRWGRGPRVPGNQGRPEGSQRAVRWSGKGISLGPRGFII